MQLKFTVQGQRLVRTDRLRPVADSKNFLGAEFEFSHQWSGCEKTAIFKSSEGAAYSVILNEDKCAVPYEVSGGEFYVSVFGIKDEMRITSDEVTVNVELSGYAEGETPQEPTQTVYEQILNRIAESEAAASEEVAEHSQNLENPHSVTKEQIGLGNVDNTADLDKPVSSAVRAVLDLKADKKEMLERIDIIESEMGDISMLSVGVAGEHDIKNLVDAANLNWDFLINALIRIIGNQTLLPSSGKTIVDNIVEINDNKAEAKDTKILFLEVEAVQTQMGDVETALDNIIEIQNTLMGGDAV